MNEFLAQLGPPNILSTFLFLSLSPSLSFSFSLANYRPNIIKYKIDWWEGEGGKQTNENKLT